MKAPDCTCLRNERDWREGRVDPKCHYHGDHTMVVVLKVRRVG